jgi:hypothetical protein
MQIRKIFISYTKFEDYEQVDQWTYNAALTTITSTAGQSTSRQHYIPYLDINIFSTEFVFINIACQGKLGRCLIFLEGLG